MEKNDEDLESDDEIGGKKKLTKKQTLTEKDHKDLVGFLLTCKKLVQVLN